jgi:hypothetical protein
LIEIILALLLSIYLFVILKDVYNFTFANVYGILYLVFYFLPGINILYDLDLFEFRLFSYNYKGLGLINMKYYLAISLLVSLAFVSGFKIIHKKNSLYNTYFKPNIKNSPIIYLFFILVAFVFISYIFTKSGYTDLYLIFLPSRKEGLIESGYVKLIGFLLPTAFAIYASLNKIKLRGIFFIICILIILISGQRRFILNLFIAIALSEYSSFKQISAKVKIIAIISSISFIPLLWYARSLSTQFQRGVEDLQITRSISYLIFGSSSSGFESLLFYKMFESKLDINFGHSVNYLMQVIVPRSMSPNKPSTISYLVREKLGHDGNPSVFYSNEMILNFDFLSITISFLFGLLLAKIFNYSDKALSVILLSSIITFFKGGFSYFITEVVFMYICYLVFKNLNRYKL